MTEKTLREYIDIITEIEGGFSPLGSPRRQPNPKRDAARQIEAEAHGSLTEEDDEENSEE